MTLLSRIDRARDGLALDAGLYAVSFAFALVTAYTSTLLPHRAWGAVAAWVYLSAFGATGLMMWKRRPSSGPFPLALPFVGGFGRTAGGRLWLTWVTFAGVALVPLVVQAVQRAGGRTDRAQEEVLVVEHMGERLIESGTPYLGPDAIAALPPGEQLMGYSPYQPGMAIFGVPRAIFGDFWWTDSRVWFAVATVAALAAAFHITASRSRNPAQAGQLPRSAGDLAVRALQAATVLPICALTLATGGDDLPVLALCVLALAFCATDRYTAAGLAVGAAAALKLFALPVVIVLAVLAVATGHGRRFLPAALGLPVLVLIPAFLVDANAFIENVLRFPLGHGIVTSPAQSPFPGYLISSAVPGGRYVAVGLLVAVGAAIGVRLLLRPPRAATTAGLYCGYGLLAAILLMPTTRFGYLLYPIALLIWAAALSPLNRDATAHPSRDALTP